MALKKAGGFDYFIHFIMNILYIYYCIYSDLVDAFGADDDAGASSVFFGNKID